MRRYAAAVFDLDGTLIDSDAALIDPFLALGVPESDITFGHVLEEECRRLGIDAAAYIEAYDIERAKAFPGVDEMLRQLDRWGVCSNKHASAGRAELARLGWEPSVALFTDAFDGPKSLGPVAELMKLPVSDLLYVGDTDHDRAVAEAAGAGFAFAGWNERRTPPGDSLVLRDPADVLGWLR